MDSDEEALLRTVTEEDRTEEPGKKLAMEDVKIPRDSYTALRLYNSTPETMHRESQVLIVGPIPIDWLKQNRDLWGKKRFANMRRLLPQTAIALKNLVKKKPDEQMATIEQVNNELIQQMELSPQTTNSPSEPDNQPEYEHQLQRDLDAMSHEDDSRAPKTLLARLEERERLSGAVDEAAKPESVFSAPSALQPTAPVAIAVSGAADDDDNDHVHAPQAQSQSLYYTPGDDSAFLRPGLIQGQSYQSSNIDSFVTAPQSLESSSDGIVPSIQIHPAPPSETIEEVENDADYETVDEEEEDDDDASVDTIKPRHSARAYLREIMDRDEEDNKKHGIRKRAADQTKKMAGGALQVGGKTAGMVMNRAERGVTFVGQRGRRAAQGGTRLMSANRFLKRKKLGEVVRLEKLLVTVKHSPETYLPPDFNESEGSQTRLVERWKEYIVVARNSGNDAAEEATVTLQFHTSRNIAKVESQNKRPKSKLDIELNAKDFRVNLYSSLDKTIALWKSSEKGTLIYIFQAKSKDSALSWLLFFAGVIGIKRENTVHLKVPNFNVSADIPFSIDDRRKLVAKKPDPMVSYQELRTFDASPSRIVKHLFNRAVDTMQDIDPLKEAIDRDWANVKLGLAWRRYDRLEWIWDLNEEQVQTAWAMLKTHDLELRPKSTYTRSVVFEDGAEMGEPPTIEGFLTRLSSWQGHAQHNKMFFKRIYLHTHDNLLFYSKATKALPPRPEQQGALDVSNDAELEELARNLPLMYTINPFEVDEETGDIKWINSGDFDTRNNAALYEMLRRVASISRSDGFVDLTELSAVRAVDDDEESVQIYQTDDILTERGCLLELVLETNPVVLRLRCHNRASRDQWVQSLSELMRYWKRRLREDIVRTNAVRAQNLKTLQIDDDMEAFISEAVPKWETSRGIADPLTYNISGVSWSRSIHMKGSLYQKPTKFSSFQQYYAVLFHGQLVLYSPYSRDSSGNKLPRISYEKFQTIELKECYVYSGLITATDLMNRDQWFDKNNPGQHALPRVYPDGWKSAEEELMRSFVLWFGRKRVKAKNNELKLVNRLGVNGVAMVFVTRSRQERDQWVSALSVEISRAANDSFKDIALV